MFSKKWLIRIGLGSLALIGLCSVAIYAEWKVARHRGQEMLDAEIAIVDVEDSDWRAADLCAKRNAALPFREKNSALRAMQAYELVPEDYLAWKREELKAATDSLGILADGDELRIAAAWHRDALEAILIARTIRQLPRGGFELTYKEPDLINTSLQPTARTRNVSNLLDHDAFILAHNGETDEAIRTLLAMLQTSRAIGDEPFLISQIVRMATTTWTYRATQRTLGLCEPKSGLAELQAAFAEELSVPRLTHAFRGERAIFHHLLENVDSGSLDIAPGKSGFQKSVQSASLRRSIPKQQAVVLDYFGRLLDAEKLSGAERIAAFRAIKEPIPRGDSDFVLVGLFLPAVGNALDIENRNRAVISTTIVALACERFRLINGSFPNSVAEIPKSLLPQTPFDPFTSKPFKYKTLDDGIVIYSPGQDLADDGGTNLDLSAKVGADIGFKLLHPNKRRQPAPPRPSVPADEPIDP